MVGSDRIERSTHKVTKFTALRSPLRHRTVYIKLARRTGIEPATRSFGDSVATLEIMPAY
jgi:hypothetical protein